MNWRSRTGKIIYFVHLQIKRKGDVMPDQLKIWLIKQSQYIILGTGKIVIQAENLIGLIQESFT
jgi:hypothetical protein